MMLSILNDQTFEEQTLYFCRSRSRSNDHVTKPSQNAQQIDFKLSVKLLMRIVWRAIGIMAGNVGGNVY